MKKSLITKIIFLLFVILLVTFCSMNVYTMNFYKAEIEGIEGIDSSVVADITSDATFKLTLAAIVWSVLLMVIIAAALNRLIVKPLKGIDNQVKKLTNYNFAKDDTGFIEKNMYRKDEIGQVCDNFESMRLNIVGLLCEINDVCNNLNLNVDNLAEISGVASDTAVQLSSTVNEVASGASDQADEISEGDKQVRMLSDLIGVVQEDMRVLNEATKEVSLLKEAGLEALEIVVHASESNLKNSHSTHEIIMETSEQTKRIQAASSQIRDISEQTNLLALNASIEAARAGEAGRGFAVVASEIGNLATVTNELTATIEEIISDLVIKMSDAVKMIGEMEESTSEESESVTNTQMQFNRIAIHLEKMESLCAQLDSSTRAMEESRTSIVQMIDSLSAISEENAACMEEAAASVEEQAKSIENVSTTSDEVAAMSQKLSKEVGQFTY